jgi:hypothetical protein
MDYEIEVHPVGDASKAGDAISMRYRVGDAYEIIVVDGGTDDSGAALVEHITTYYGEDAFINHVVSTHPDSDHACGLREVIKNFSVGTLWLHGVWHHAEEILPYFANKRWTAEGLADAIRERYSVIETLIDLATEKGTIVREPFQGEQIGPFTVLSPERTAYLRLVPQFRKTPDADVDALKAVHMFIEPAVAPSWLGQILERAASWIDEEWDVELLRENPVTAAENESSTILYGQFGDHTVLLTADGGVNALTWAQDHAESLGWDISSPTLIQVPHHGSRSNVSPSILNRILGPKRAAGSSSIGMAIVSAPKDDAKHPRKMVMNAFHRRGFPVHKTQGSYFRKYSNGMPSRTNEVAAVPFGWFDQVEEYD